MMVYNTRRFVTTSVPLTVALLVITISAYATYPGDNGRITFVANLSGTYQLYTINSDGSDMIQITSLPPSENNCPCLPDYSPDGQRILFLHDMTGSFEFYVINADGSGFMQLTNDPTRLKLFGRWSPDGSRIVFTLESLRTHRTVMATMAADGTGQNVALTTDLWDSFQPTYTPDGEQIVFASQIGGLICAVWIMNADGSHQRRLTAAALGAGGPDVSPDGKDIAFTDHISMPLPNSIFKMNIRGNHLKRLTEPGNLLGSYSPDGKKIVFSGRPGLGRSCHSLHDEFRWLGTHEDRERPDPPRWLPRRQLPRP